jgi:hypothetical protein
MDTLATAADVAAALGLGADEDALTEEQKARAELLLAKVSRRFRLEAQRHFTPGTYTHHLKIFAGAVRLEEIPDEVVDVKVPGVDGVSYSLVKNWITFDEYWRPEYTGKTAEVTYTWSTPVPTDVVAAVADIVARNLMLDPTSVVGQSKTLSTLDYRQDVADWASAGVVGMNGEDVALARSYRYPAPPSVVLHP